MCGIFFYLNQVKINPSHFQQPNEDEKNEKNEKTFTNISYFQEKIKRLLNLRGPDYFKEIEIPQNKIGKIVLMSSVLHLRGKEITNQPFVSRDGKKYLSFNGEIFDGKFFDLKRNDGEILFRELKKCGSQEEIVQVVSEIRGPFTLVYIDLENYLICVCKDVLGRRSLLYQNNHQTNEVYFSSIVDVEESGDFSNWEELEIRNLCFFKKENEFWTLDILKWSDIYQKRKWCFPFSKRLKFVEDEENWKKEKFEKYVKGFEEIMMDAVKKRIYCNQDFQENKTFKLGILFSGGIDSLYVAILASLIMKKDQEIDLLNVNFGEKISSDRKQAISALQFLKEKFPERKFRLILIDRSKKDIEDSKRLILRLIYPRNTVLDYSIATALFFASSAKGTEYETNEEYESPSKVLLSGLGADELLGGYGRHRTKFTKNINKWEKLNDELDLDLGRLWKRNFGRDDRIVSFYGKEIRFPFLDLKFIHFIRNEVPLNYVCDLSKEKGIGDKMILRRAVAKFSKEHSMNVKRAIQFGTNIAKLSCRKKKGHDIMKL